MVVVEFHFIYDGRVYHRVYSFSFIGNTQLLTDIYVKNIINNEYMNPSGLSNYRVNIDKTTATSILTEQTFNLEDMILRKQKPMSINNLYNEVIENKNWKHCIHDFLKFKYKKLSKKTIETLHTTNDIYDWCVSYNIKLIVYNIEGKIIKSFYPNKKNGRHTNLIYIAHNNHLYPLKNKILNKVRIPKEYKIEIVDNCEELFLDYIKEYGDEPKCIGII